MGQIRWRGYVLEFFAIETGLGSSWILREACPERSRRAQNDIYERSYREVSEDTRTYQGRLEMGTPEGSRELDRLLDRQLTEKLEWLEEAETLSLRLRARRAVATAEAGQSRIAIE
jgi:hypothetical protein